MKTKKTMFACWIILGLIYNLLPAFIRDTGSGMFLLLLILPAATLSISAFYGSRQDSYLFFPCISGFLFVPAVFLYMNTSAFFYVLLYEAVSFAGYGIGKCMTILAGENNN